MPDPTEIRLAAERTALSWRRTCLGTVAVALLMLRAVLQAGWDASALAPGIAGLILLVVAGTGYRRNLQLHHGAGGSGSMTIRWTTVAVVVAVAVTVGFALATPAAG
ncbi:DUF202 domain-containing protein [Nocardia flavorosea]|uniref:DUF202 domain-containing protein n=1 Tax=Nocardia flavorosea TaxID=53429 RepID=UPI001895A18A|nr:DUF202 domain-containing protein [Nocardia flavorosea]MBF6348897.1 DUF202 domain-containing protein [Nocardia flavorosea]